MSGGLSPEAIDRVATSRNYFQTVKNRIGELYATDTLALAFLEEHRFSDAGRLYRDSNFRLEEFDTRTILLYNYGRTLEQSGQSGEAFEAYLRALSFSPSPAETAAAAARTAPSVEQVLRAIATLYSSGKADEVRTLVRIAIERFPDPRLVHEAVRLYTFLGLSRDSFASEEQPVLARVIASTVNERVRDLLREVIVAYQSHLQPGIGTARVFPEWGTSRIEDNSWPLF